VADRAMHVATDGTTGRGRNERTYLSFTRRELSRLSGMYGFIALLNILGWGFFLSNKGRFGPEYAAAGSLAFVLGIRHAFDADHISAVDDTTRYLMQRGKRPLGVGFFFSLGHSTIVFSLALGLAVAAEAVRARMPALERVGGTLGATISGTFLILIGILDLLILLGIVDVWKKMKSGKYSAGELDDLMMQRGFINRILGSRWRRFVSDSWQMYPVGVLFGLGFDTASQIGLLALTAGVAGGATNGGGGGASFLAAMALPLLFAGGMSFMDTTDGVIMSRAYGWAFKSPVRKIYYNMTTVGLGVFVALGIGTVEYLQVIGGKLGFTGGFWNFLDNVDFELLGYAIVGTFVALWIGSVLFYRFARVEEKYGHMKVDVFTASAEAREPE